MTSLSDMWTTDATWVVPKGWRQGRGAWGGLVVGQVVTAASHELPDVRLVPRSVWVSMLAPVKVGPVTCAVTNLRSGKATVAREVTLTDAEGALLTRATVVYGIPRDPTAVSEASATAPLVAPTAGTALPLGPPLAPEFTSQLRFMPVTGFPYSGQPELVTAGWVGLKPEDGEPLTPALVAALSDAWWTTSIVGIDGASFPEGPPPVATLDFALSFPQRLVDEPDVWATGLWHCGHVVGGTDGYLTEIRTLHSPGGKLLAFNTQMQAVGGTRSIG